MAAEGFFKPSKTIAAILILTPLVLTIVAQLLQLFASSIDPTFALVVNSFLAPVVPSLLIAATFLLKFRKTLSYYLIFYLPYALFVIILPFAVGAVPLSAFSTQFAAVFLIIFSPILVFLIFNPLFFAWLPRRLLRLKRYGAAAACALLYLVVVRFAFLITSSITSGQPYTYALTYLEIFSDALYLVLAVIYSGILFLQFKKYLKHSE